MASAATRAAVATTLRIAWPAALPPAPRSTEPAAGIRRTRAARAAWAIRGAPRAFTVEQTASAWRERRRAPRATWALARIAGWRDVGRVRVVSAPTAFAATRRAREIAR